MELVQEYLECRRTFEVGDMVRVEYIDGYIRDAKVKVLKGKLLSYNQELFEIEVQKERPWIYGIPRDLVLRWPYLSRQIFKKIKG
ncbi:hypothetical protein [Alicyclobacillus shizuokensis]|uniref:hypothetical protein n=1 Tax=Alicyclobacillus shizuokensis TaxID=392014 RepID=UPI00082EB9CE|nr:hypothetical protein [Alicyclobacillus shizuokensis]